MIDEDEVDLPPFTAYRPAQVSEPTRWDHEGRSGDERVIEFVAGL